MRKGPRPPLQPATPRPRAHRRHGGWAPVRPLGASPGTATAAAESREGAYYGAQSKPSHIHTSTPPPYPPKAAFPEGRLRLVRPPTP